MVDFLTRPRAGAPSTVDLAPEEWETFLAPIGIPYVSPLFALMEEMTVTVADLCAAPPPPEERWTINDILAALIPGQSDLMRQKLERMAFAKLWPTYCEYYPASVPDGGALDGTPKFLAQDGFGFFTQNSNPPTYTIPGTSQRVVTSGPMTTEDVWFYTIWKRCLVQPTDGTRPALHHFDATNTNLQNVYTGDWPINEGIEAWALILPQNIDLTLGTPPHRWGMTASATGTWLFQITAWTRAVPPTPEPWALAPALPQPFQFSDECAAALCAMAAAYPPDATDLTEINVKLDLLLSDLPAGVEVEGSANITGGPQVFAVPAAAVGCVIDLAIPSRLSRQGSAPTAYWSVGFVAEGTDLGWFGSHRVKHDPYVLWPFSELTTQLALDLEPDVTGSLLWLVPQTS